MATQDRGWFERAALQTRRWTHLLLGVLVVDVFVVPPLRAVGVLPLWVAAVAATGTLLAAAAALGSHRAARGLVFTVVALALVGRWVHHFAGGVDATAVLNAAATCLAAATFAGLFLVDVFAKGKLPDRLYAVLLAYILLGSAWAQAYHAIDLVFPGSLTLPGSEHPASEYIYFSFSTLTSVAYGDVLPVNPLVRSLAVLEALTGQLYIVLVVSRFVGPSFHGGRDRTEVGSDASSVPPRPPGESP